MSPSATHIVLIHGLWLPPHSWSGWIERYRAAGCTVHAPAWPGVSDIDEELDHTKAPDDVGIAAATEHFAKVVRGLSEPPIIIGHSMGGLITQLLLDRGLGRAGVAIQPSRPRGVLRLPLSMLRSAWPVLRDPRHRGRVVPISARHFHYVFANTLSRAESDRWHAQLAIAAPARPIFDMALAEFTPKSRAPTAINFANPDRAPLLLVAGNCDNAMPESMVYENFARYRRSSAPTAFKVFHHRPHLITVIDGWHDVADYALTWTARLTR
jgi:alpha-beta hydrolase superfamily lysophospholipase